jgi:hypothetical protein
MSDVGRMGATLRKVATLGDVSPGYPEGMRRVISAVLIIIILGIVREMLLDRTPRQQLEDGNPVIGSLDTWPAVPRRPEA